MYFEAFKTQSCGQRFAEERKAASRIPRTKKGAGRISHSPRCSSRFAYERSVRLWCYPHVCSLGGQNLAALCTAAGENLTAVGRSHSLAETMNLGTMTTAGLVGTLHKFTPPIFLFSYARQPYLAAATHTKAPDHSQAEPL